MDRHEPHPLATDLAREGEAWSHLVLDRKVRQRQLSDVTARIDRSTERLSPGEGQSLNLVARKGADLVVGCSSPQGIPHCRHA